MLFVIHYSFDLRFNDALRLCLGASVSVLGTGVLVLWVDVLVLVVRVTVLVTTLDVSYAHWHDILHTDPKLLLFLADREIVYCTQCEPVTCMTRDGPPVTISCGIWVRGQFSMLMICRLEQRASSSGRLCKLGLSFMYRDSSDSNVPMYIIM